MTDKPVDRQTTKNHLTTRRGFVTAAGFGVVSLYGLWAGYGAAPMSFDFSNPGGGGHGGHGGGGGMSPEEFRRLAEQFIEDNSLPDGSVMPGKAAGMMGETDGHDSEMPGRGHAMAESGGDAHAAEPEPHDMAVAEPNGHGAEELLHSAGMSMENGQEEAEQGHAMAEPGGHDDADGAGHETAEQGHAMAEAGYDSGGADQRLVYLMCDAWAYLPGVLRLQRGLPYKFRMMALDVDHGASINLGAASRIIRLRKHVLVEADITFTEPGMHPVYCTVYCGQAHDYMRGSIVVA